MFLDEMLPEGIPNFSYYNDHTDEVGKYPIYHAIPFSIGNLLNSISMKNKGFKKDNSYDSHFSGELDKDTENDDKIIIDETGGILN